MKKIILFVFVLIIALKDASAQKFYLGNYLTPTENEFQLIGISSKTNVQLYKYKKPIYDTFYDRKIGDIVVGIKNGYIVQTVYCLIPKTTDVGVPKEVVNLAQAALPYPFGNHNGVYGMNIDNESISIARLSNAVTFNKDRIVFSNSVKQSILVKN
jgi:hypothetical protein